MGAGEPEGQDALLPSSPARKARMRLRPKLILAFLLVVTLSAGGLGVIVVDLISRSLESSAQEMLEHDLQMAWAEYLARGQQMRYGMQQAAAEPSIQALVRQRQSTALRSLLRTWYIYRPYVDLWLVTDPAGQVIARLNTDQRGDTTPFNELVAEVVALQEPLLSTEILSYDSLVPEGLSTPAGEDGLVVVAAVPVLCDGVTVCGVIVTGDLLNGDPHVPDTLREKLHGHLEHAVVGEELHGPIIFLSRGTTIISTSLREPGGDSALGNWLVETVLAQVQAGQPYRGTLNIQGASFLTAVDPIRNARGELVGTLAVGLPEQYFWALRHQTLGAIVLILGLGIVLAMGVAAVLAYRLTRPLQELTGKAQAIAAGDLKVRAHAEGEDEIGELARAFNQMAQQLQHSYEAISQERRKVVAAIEASRDAIWISDASRHIVMVNSALEQLTGYHRAELIGQSCRYRLNVCTKNGRSICDVACPFLHPAREVSGTIEGLIPSSTGKAVWIEISYGRVSDPDRHLASVIHIVRDLTPHKEVERLKDEFLSMVTHELRTPLHHIKGFATTLLQTDVQWDAASQRDFLESIDREADRLAKLVDNLLQMSRIEADGLQVTQRRWCRVADLTAGALRRLRTETRPFRLQVLVPDHLPPVLVDEQGLEGVIANLVENATKYSPPGSAITLHAAVHDGHLVFCVADQGAGIPPEHQPHLFERFYRVDVRQSPAAAKPVPPVAGIGLGLAICKRVVEAHGGRIWVESAPGAGSRFFFELPLETN